MARYYLSQWVYACFPADGTVFLDIERDMYLGLNAAQTQLFKRLLDDPEQLDEAQATLACELLENGLLTTRAEHARPLAPTCISLPSTSLAEDIPSARPRIRSRHVVRFLAACVSVGIRFKYRSSAHAVARLAELKRRTSAPAGCDDEQVRALVEVFRYLRPLVYVERDNCLYDSLVLADFLRRFGIRTTCVFGVRNHPFAAHCWVQTDKFTINSTAEFARHYVPIAAV